MPGIPAVGLRRQFHDGGMRPKVAAGRKRDRTWFALWQALILALKASGSVDNFPALYHFGCRHEMRQFVALREFTSERMPFAPRRHHLQEPLCLPTILSKPESRPVIAGPHGGFGLPCLLPTAVWVGPERQVRCGRDTGYQSLGRVEEGPS